MCKIPQEYVSSGIFFLGELGGIKLVVRARAD